MEMPVAQKNVLVVVRKPYAKPHLVVYGGLKELTRTTREFGTRSDSSRCIKNKTG